MSHLKNLHRSMGGTILVTGGAGYVGSHCVLELLQAGYQVGKLSNCKKSTIYKKSSDLHNTYNAVSGVVESGGLWRFNFQIGSGVFKICFKSILNTYPWHTI